MEKIPEIDSADATLPGEARVEAAYAVAGYIFAVLFSFAIGYRMNIPYWYFQFLDLRLLQNRLAESLLYLHAQPPLMNLFLGLALKLEASTGLSAAVSLFLFHFILGGLGVFATAYAANTIIRDRLHRRVALAVIVFHPVFYSALFEFFYTFHEIVILACLPYAIWRYLRDRALSWFAIVCGLLLWLCLTRSLFHFIWALSVPVLLLAVKSPGSRAPGARRKGLEFLILAVTAVLVLAWPFKNWVIFESFTYSTWQGYSLAKGTVRNLGVDDDIERPPPPPEFDIPALAWVDKVDPQNTGHESKNWNHYALIGQFRERQRLALEKLRMEPGTLLRKIGNNYWSFSRFTGRNPYTAAFGSMAKVAPGVADIWMRLYEALLVQELRSSYYLRDPYGRESQVRFPYVSCFYFTFPVILLLTIRKIWKRWTDHPLESRVATFMLYTVLWVLAMILLVDGNEANRIRTSTEPYLLLLFFWMLPAGFLQKIRNRGRVGPEAGGAPTSGPAPS